MTHQPSDDRSPPPRAYTAGVTLAKTAGTVADGSADRCRGDRCGLHWPVCRSASGGSGRFRDGAGGQERGMGRLGPGVRPGGPVSEARRTIDRGALRQGRCGSDSRCGRSRAGPCIRLDRTARHRLQRRAQRIDFRGTCGWRVSRAGATCQVLAGDRRAGAHAGRFRVRGGDRIILLSRCPAR